jgi:hypothetical protein
MARERGVPEVLEVVMSDIKRTVRDTAADVKETWRRADGDESPSDMAKNAGDRLRNAVEDAGDKVHETVDRTARDVEYERGRVDEAADEDALRRANR